MQEAAAANRSTNDRLNWLQLWSARIASTYMLVVISYLDRAEKGRKGQKRERYTNGTSKVRRDTGQGFNRGA